MRQGDNSQTGRDLEVRVRNERQGVIEAEEAGIWEPGMVGNAVIPATAAAVAEETPPEH